MSLTIFYSWQSDSPQETNRNFIESVLKNAVKALGQDVDLQESLRDENVVLDKDTAGVPGSPPIVDTILNKISGCSVFVPDLTFVGHTAAGRPIPNPNVLIEYGWALKVLGHACIVPVMNTAFGEPSPTTLPFDMRHLRQPTTYCLEADHDPETKSRVKRDLIAQMTKYLKLVISARRISTATAEPFAGTPHTEDPSIFLKTGETLTRVGRFTTAARGPILPAGQRLFLRFIPDTPLTTIRSSQMALDLVRKGGLRPMMESTATGISYGRNPHGGFCFDHDGAKILGLSQLLQTGELWGVDAFTINIENLPRHSDAESGYFAITSVERVFVATLHNYLEFARESLQLKAPLRYKAGAANVKGYRIAMRGGFNGDVVIEHIIYEGVIDDLNADARVILRPFFNYFWEECGLKRPDVDVYL
jgi:hypothetical protein